MGKTGDLRRYRAHYMVIVMINKTMASEWIEALNLPRQRQRGKRKMSTPNWYLMF